VTAVPAATNAELKVLSLHQPSASLVMLGVKTFETRPGPPNGDMRPEGVRAGVGGCSVNRGDIIGIASTQNPEGITAEGLTEGGWAYNYFGPEGEYQACWCFRTSDEGRRGDTILTGPGIEVEDEGSVMPLGFLLGTVRVVDAYPMIDPELGWQYDLDTPEIAVLTDIDELHVAGPFDATRDISSELPYGDWTPGRWAIELADPTPTTVRCPGCAGQPKAPEVRVEGGALSCRFCNRTQTFNFMRDRGTDCVCARALADSCPLCLRAGVCEPVPVSGMQGVWRLTADRLRGKAAA
jgi:hypothetical protein